MSKRPWYQRVTLGYIVKDGDPNPTQAYVVVTPHRDDLRLQWGPRKHAARMPRHTARQLVRAMRIEGRASARVVRLVRVIP